MSKGIFHYQEGVPKVKEEDEQADEEGDEEAEDEDDGAPEVAQVAPVPVPAAKGAKKKRQQGATADEDGGEQSVT